MEVTTSCLLIVGYNILTFFFAVPFQLSFPPPPSSAFRLRHSSCSMSFRKCRCAQAGMALCPCGMRLWQNGNANETLCACSSSILLTWSASLPSPFLWIVTDSFSCCACCFWSVWTGMNFGFESGPCWPHHSSSADQDVRLMRGKYLELCTPNGYLKLLLFTINSSIHFNNRRLAEIIIRKLLYTAC